MRGERTLAPMVARLLVLMNMRVNA